MKTFLKIFKQAEELALQDSSNAQAVAKGIITWREILCDNVTYGLELHLDHKAFMQQEYQELIDARDELPF
jgi:hypothetical protein